ERAVRLEVEAGLVSTAEGGLWHHRKCGDDGPLTGCRHNLSGCRESYLGQKKPSGPGKQKHKGYTQTHECGEMAIGVQSTHGACERDGHGERYPLLPRLPSPEGGSGEDFQAILTSRSTETAR